MELQEEDISLSSPTSPSTHTCSASHHPQMWALQIGVKS